MHSFYFIIIILFLGGGGGNITTLVYWRYLEVAHFSSLVKSQLVRWRLKLEGIHTQWGRGSILLDIHGSITTLDSALYLPLATCSRLVDKDVKCRLISGGAVLQGPPAHLSYASFPQL